jgi:hypothetical protein
MSEAQATQTAVDAPDATATPVVEGNGAQNKADDLDTLLSEFDEGANKTSAAAQTQPEPKTVTDNDLKQTYEQMRAFVGEAQGLRFRQDMDATIKDVRGDLDSDLFDADFVESWLDGQARKDPRLANAWANRSANPKAFQKVKTELGRNFQKKYGKLPDKGATEDREAVTAAVRGASTQAPASKAPDFSGMSNAEFREAHKKHYGYYPNV